MLVVPDYHGHPLRPRDRRTTRRDPRPPRGPPRPRRSLDAARRGEAYAAIDPMMTDRSRGLARLRVAIERLRGDGVRRLVAIGYSCGGTIVFDAARTGMQLEGVVGFFGLVDPLQNRPRVMRTVPERRVPLLAIVGGGDELVTPDTWALRPSSTASASTGNCRSSGAKHAFTLRQEDNLEVQSSDSRRSSSTTRSRIDAAGPGSRRSSRSACPDR